MRANRKLCKVTVTRHAVKRIISRVIRGIVDYERIANIVREAIEHGETLFVNNNKFIVKMGTHIYIFSKSNNSLVLKSVVSMYRGPITTTTVKVRVSEVKIFTVSWLNEILDINMKVFIVRFTS